MKTEKSCVSRKKDSVYPYLTIARCLVNDQSLCILKKLKSHQLQPVVCCANFQTTFGINDAKKLKTKLFHQ